MERASRERERRVDIEGMREEEGKRWSCQMHFEFIHSFELRVHADQSNSFSYVASKYCVYVRVFVFILRAKCFVCK